MTLVLSRAVVHHRVGRGQSCVRRL